MKQLLFTAVVAALSSAAFLSCQKDKQPEVAEWNLVWEDDFNQPDLDTAVWTKIPRGTSDWNNYMSSFDSCYALKDGNLILRGIINTSCPADTAPYLTGGIYSKDKKTFENGRLEIRAKLHGARGEWPAFWMLPDQTRYVVAGDSVKAPDEAEIDIMERLNYDSIAYQTVHSYYTLRLHRDTIPPHYATGPIKPDDYNVFAVEMYADSLRFFINDNHTFTYPRIDTDLPGQFPFDRAFYLLLDMQLGGSWVGAVDPADLPVEMKIDWVRFYQKN